MAKKENIKKNLIKPIVGNLIENVCVKTVGENIVATTKIQNNYGAIQSLIFPILR